MSKKKEKVLLPIKGANFYELFISSVNKDKKLKDPSKKEFDTKLQKFLKENPKL